jgi:hypothetical protein
MSDDMILAYIKNFGASCNLSADDILCLNNQGVSQPVVSGAPTNSTPPAKPDQ